MTAGRAVIIGLIRRYLNGLLDPFITLLEVHKLMYFMQATGEPLKLDFQKHHYGPYATNLRHVLSSVEGHLISGYSDGVDAPGKRLDLVPGAVEDAAAFLQEHPATRERMESVAQLVDGFESPFGLELLATVHWVAVRHPAASVEEIIDRTYAWGRHKRQFSERQIRLAMERLGEKGWLKTEPQVNSAAPQ